MDFERYMDEIVDPTIADFEANPTSTRHAFLACVALFHTVDYFQYPDRDGNLRKHLRDESLDFAHVDRVAHAFKHVETGHVNDPSYQPLKADEVIERPPAIWGQFTWGLSVWNDATGGVTLNGERELDLLATLKRATAFMRGKIRP